MKRKVFFPIFLFVNIIISPCYGQQKIGVTYISNAGFLIESSGKKIIIDALFKQGWDNYLIPEESIVSDIINQQDAFTHSNLMMITHHHGDHFDPSMVVAYLMQNSENILIAPPKVTDAIKRHPEIAKFEKQIVHLDKVNHEKNDTTIQGIRIRSFFIQHDSRPEIENVAYLIDLDEHRILHSGDNTGADISEFEKLQLQQENIDLALLNFYGFWNTKEEQAFTIKYINPKEIALIHIPPAEIEAVMDSVDVIKDFIEITVFESSMERKTFLFE